MKKKQIRIDEQISISLTLRERDLIQKHTTYDPDFAALAEIKNNKIQIKLSLDEIDEVHGYIAAEANHCDDRKLEKELDSLCEKLKKIEDSFEEIE
jgi:hypothetical protein